MIFPPPFLRKECGAGFIPHKRSAHLFCSARFDFYKCQNKKQKGKKKHYQQPRCKYFSSLREL